MTEFYSHTDYRKSLRWALDRLALRGEKVTNQELATSMRVQNPYLSKVFSGGADLSEDQLFLASQRLGLSEEESEYMSLLLAQNRAVVKERKEILTRKIQRIQKRKLSPSENRNAPQVETGGESALGRYYLEPWAQIVHMYLLIPKWLKNPLELADETGLGRERLVGILKILEEIGVLELKAGAYRLLRDQLHLPKSSPLCAPQQILMKTLSLQRSMNPASESYSFLATFAANEKTRVKIQGEFVQFLKKVEELVSDAPNEDVYQIQFDLFSWG